MYNVVDGIFTLDVIPTLYVRFGECCELFLFIENNIFKRFLLKLHISIIFVRVWCQANAYLYLWWMWRRAFALSKDGVHVARRQAVSRHGRIWDGWSVFLKIGLRRWRRCRECLNEHVMANKMRVNKGYEALHVDSLQDERNSMALIIYSRSQACVHPWFEANRFGKCSRDIFGGSILNCVWYGFCRNWMMQHVGLRLGKRLFTIILRKTRLKNYLHVEYYCFWWGLLSKLHASGIEGSQI